MDNIDKVKAIVKEIQNLFFVKKYNLIILETKKAFRGDLICCNECLNPKTSVLAPIILFFSL